MEPKNSNQDVDMENASDTRESPPQNADKRGRRFLLRLRRFIFGRNDSECENEGFVYKLEGKKKLIVITVVLAVFFIAVCFLCWLDFYLVVAAVECRNSVADNPSGAIAQLVVSVFGTVAIIGCTFGTIGISSGCLGFAIHNSRSEIKRFKVLNIVFACLFAAGVAAGVTAIILFGVL